MTDALAAPRRSSSPWTFDSGAAVAKLFHRGLALIFLVAWISLGAQVRLLIGANGLLPLIDFTDAARAQGVLSFLTFPSVLTLSPRDGVLVAGTAGGALLSALAFLGVAPRLCMALQTFLYLSFATACRSFLGFQWDNLLLEAGLLAAFLPVDRPAPLAHFLMRALLFKLYFESGLAKWQSPAGDWRDGSAMTYYYQTAPLPTALAWYAHQLPAAWHHFESHATLVLELIVPFAIFGPRRARLLAAGAFTGFQLVNAATANYAFFCHLAVALHLFLLDDRDVVRFLGWWSAAAARVVPANARSIVTRIRTHRARVTAFVTRSAWRTPLFARARPIVSALGAGAWLALSGAQALFHFGGLDGSDALSRALIPALELSQTFRVVNTYHLFAAVTRERIEPEFQLQVDQTSPSPWIPLSFKYKPGPTQRPPRFVAPHQPRVDFLLWFYGLSFARAQPAYVTGLLGKLCDDPAAVATLFTDGPLRNLHGQAVRAVRIVFWDYRLTTSDERRATGDWWHRREIHDTPPLTCAR